MSKGDNLFGIETYYKKIKMRSRLETKLAFFLDSLNIIWVYEPKTFLLSSGLLYKPDFYLPEQNIWLEVKGVIEKHNKEISECFVRDNHTEIMLISDRETYWFSAIDFFDGIGIDNKINLGLCSHCQKYFFCSGLGSYHCRNCKYQEGDHDLICEFNGWQNDKIDFSDLDSIKEFIKSHGVSVSTNKRN